jgi:gluconate 2-dehydrogenase
MTERPRVWVSQPLFDDIVARLDAYFDVERTPAATAWTPEQVAGKLRDADGALVTVGERIGAAGIAGAPRLRAAPTSRSATTTSTSRRCTRVASSSPTPRTC